MVPIIGRPREPGTKGLPPCRANSSRHLVAPKLDAKAEALTTAESLDPRHETRTLRLGLTEIPEG